MNDATDPKKSSAKRRRGAGEGSYFKRTRTLADGRTVTDHIYLVSLGYDEHGRRVRRKFSAATKAEAKLRADQARASAGGRIRRRGKHTVGEFLEEWLAEVGRSRSARTAADYGWLLRKYVIPNIGKQRLDEINVERIGWLYATLRERGSSADQIKKVHQPLRRAFNVAIGRGLITANPTAFVERPRHRSKKRWSYTAEEVVALLTDARGSRLEALFRLAIVGSMRPGELYALARADLDLDRAQLDVRNNLEEVKGELNLAPAKADSARRIPLTAATVRLLREHLARVDAEIARAKRRGARKASEYVFASERGQWLRTGRVNAELRRVALSAKLRPPTMYELRHTAVSLFGEAGVHLRVAADMAGHAGTEITANVYTHAFDAMHREGVARVETMLDCLENVGAPVGA